MNKLKERVNHEIKTIMNKYNAAVYVLNGGSTMKALALFNYNVGGKGLKGFCKSANPEGYKTLMEIERNKTPYGYYDEVYLFELRENKHLFIGGSEWSST